MSAKKSAWLSSGYVVFLMWTLGLVFYAHQVGRRMQLFHNACGISERVCLRGYDSLSESQIMALVSVGYRGALRICALLLEELEVFGSIFCRSVTLRNKVLMQFWFNRIASRCRSIGQVL